MMNCSGFFYALFCVCGKLNPKIKGWNGYIVPSRFSVLNVLPQAGLWCLNIHFYLYVQMILKYDTGQLRGYG
jgi:hypothetical protein